MENHKKLLNCNVVDKTTLSEETQKKIENNKFFYGLHKFVYQYALETYYKKIEEFTFKTFFIPITVDKANRMYDCCKVFYDVDRKEITFDEKIVKEIDEIIQKNFKSKGVFIKLSTRSPKDSVRERFNENLEKLILGEFEKNSEDLVHSFLKAHRKSMNVKSGKEAFEMLITSSRVREDLYKFLEFPNAFKLNLIIREWCDVDPALEFRGFVYKNKLTAVSQYCYLDYFPSVIAKKKEIEKLLFACFEKLQKRIPHENYVIDFAVIEDEEKKDSFKDVKVIELNPFFNDTGSCLFNWGDDHQVLKGEKEFEFRLNMKKLKNPLESLPVIWKKYIIEWMKKNGREDEVVEIEINEEREKSMKKAEKKKINNSKKCSIM